MAEPCNVWLLFYGDEDEYYLYSVHESANGAMEAGRLAYRRYMGYGMGRTLKSEGWRMSESGGDVWERRVHGCYLRAERFRVQA